MKGWIYVLELAPSGHVKVGRTEKLGPRLTQHLTTATFGGGAVVRVMSFATEDSRTAERELLAMLAAHPRSYIAHGRETFAGLTFMEVAGIADQVAGYRNIAAWAPDAGDLVGRCAAAMDQARKTRLSLDNLRVLLDDESIQTTRDLGRALRRAGVQPETVWCQVRQRPLSGVKRERLVLASAA